MAGDISISTIGGGFIADRNAIINGNFSVNQRVVSGTVTLAAGVYGHDRWKAGAGGCTYTFATTAGVTTLTITAGTLMQVIEGINLGSGTYTLSWSGTAQGRIDSGSYGASGITGTAVGGTNQTIEFGTGTVSLVQYEPGSTATAYVRRQYQQEHALCERYYQIQQLAFANAVSYSAGLTIVIDSPTRVRMRAVPTGKGISNSTESTPVTSGATGITQYPAGTSTRNLSCYFTTGAGTNVVQGINAAWEAEL